MKHLELHILQSFPVSCLNRDDLNSPKTAIFGGVQRARVSSQSWKRSIRELATNWLPNMKGQRTRLVVGALVERLAKSVLPQDVVSTLAEMAAAQISKIDSKKDKDGFKKVTTLCFLSKAELDSIATAILANTDLKKAVDSLVQARSLPESDKEKKKEEKKKEIEKAEKKCEKHLTQDSISKAIKAVQLKDAADIALFGRMVANDPSLTIEGASMFSHALSTHKVDNELDFFAAVDDRQPDEEAGAGMTGTLEFNSATYYRFIAINIDMFKDDKHLGVLTQDERKNVMKAFIKATLTAVPGMGKNNAGRRNSMNAFTLPGYVLGIVRSQGHPVQLVNAFEKPVWTKGKSVLEASVEKLREEYKRLTSTWEFLKEDELASTVIPEKSLEQFLDEVIQHVD